MLMVVFDPGTCSWPGPFANRVGIVKPQEALALTVVQREGIIEAVRFLGYRRNPLHFKLDSAHTFGFHDIRHAVQIEKRVEGRIPVHPLHIIIG